MDSNSKSTRLTPKKFSKNSENSNPNVENSPGFSKSARNTQKSVSRNHKIPSLSKLLSPSPKNKIHQRKFVIAKKKKKGDNTDDLSNSMGCCRCNNKGKKCLCVAYESLRASQEEFFKNRGRSECEESDIEKLDYVNGGEIGDGERNNNESLIRDIEIIKGCHGDSPVRHNARLTTLDQEVTIPGSISEGVELEKLDNANGGEIGDGEGKINELLTQDKKCFCVAYERPRASSQEDFFKNRCRNEHEDDELEKLDNVNGGEIGDGEAKSFESLIQNISCSPARDSVGQREVTIPGPFFEGIGLGDCCSVTDELGEMSKEDIGSGGLGSGTIKRRRERLLEEARRSVPEPGSGRVMHLVKAFERLLSIRKSKECEEKGEDEDEKEAEDSRKGQKWALPGLQPSNIPETHVSSSSFCPSEFFITSESLGLNSHCASSYDSSQRSFSISTRTSGGGRRSRRSSAGSHTFARRSWKRRQLKATSQKPFKLLTEERGKCKEEEFLKKVQQMVEEEEKQRIPIAQGLPWTTDAPKCLPKPPVKESTRPVDLVLHSDIRAIERAEFDHQVAEKLSLIEQYKLERERLQKMAEEEEIRRLRKELIPKAQPMPYFDRPFVPRRSTKNPTIPREPKFHIPQHKKIKCCMSWNDMYIHSNCEWGLQQ